MVTKSSSRSPSSRHMHLQRRQVLKGTLDKTSGGLTASDLKENKRGVVVSKEKSKIAKKNFAGSGAKKWVQAVEKAKKELDIRKGDPFSKHIVTGELKARATEIYEKMKREKSPARKTSPGRRRKSATRR